MEIGRRDFLRKTVKAGAGALAFGPIGRSGAASAGGKRPPNVLLLLADDQRADAIHALGNPTLRTPALDRLVHEGAVFRNTFVTVPVCTPARAELLAGSSAFRTGVRWFGEKINPELVLLAEAFGKAGYTTFFTGKWHNDGMPTDHGFAHARRVFRGGMGPHMMTFQEGDQRVVGFSSELFAMAAIDFIWEEREPWFAMVAFTAPHDPRTPPGRFKSLYDPADIPLPANYMPVHPFDNGEMTIRDELLEKWPRTQDAIRRHLADYYGMISHLDEQVGRILDNLELSEQIDNTIVVYASDNGLAIGSHGLMGKMSLYDHSVRVPLILRGPGIPAGVRSDALCYLFDLYPTLCDLCGIATPPTVEGRSLVPVLHDEAKAVRSRVFGAYRDVQRMVRTQDWKLIYYPKIDRLQLFHLAEDPHELLDLHQNWLYRKSRYYTPALDSEQIRAKGAELWTYLRDWQESVGDDLRLPEALPWRVE